MQKDNTLHEKCYPVVTTTLLLAHAELKQHRKLTKENMSYHNIKIKPLKVLLSYCTNLFTHLVKATFTTNTKPCQDITLSEEAVFIIKYKKSAKPFHKNITYLQQKCDAQCIEKT